MLRLEAMRNGEETPILDSIVFRKIRKILGGKMRMILAGGAPLSKETHDFMRVCVGAPLLQVNTTEYRYNVPKYVIQMYSLPI